MAPTTTTPAYHHAAEGSLAYTPSRWERYLWNARTDGNAGKFTPISTLGGALYDARRAEYDGADARRAGHGGASADALDFGCETFARLHDDPARAEAPISWAQDCHAHLDGLPEWDALRAAVNGDADMAALATLPILEALAGRLGDVLRDEPEERRDGNGSGPQGDQAGEGAGDEPADTAGQRALRAALRRAVDDATQQVRDAREALSGLMPGDGVDGGVHGAQDGRRLELARALLAQPALRDILRRAGKIQQVADAKARRDPSARSEVVGIERGNDVSRMLPSEATLLADSDLEILWYARFAERGLLQYALRGKTPLGRGPIVVALDESSSMRGESERWAHAAAVAAILQGRKERREVAVIAFNGGISAAWIMDVTGAVHRTDTRNPTVMTDDATTDAGGLVMELLARRSSGGTAYEPVIEWTLAYLAEREPRADLVLVTDGFCSLPAAMVEQVAAELTRELRIFGVVVGGGRLSPEVAGLCEDVVDASEGPDALARAVPR